MTYNYDHVKIWRAKNKDKVRAQAVRYRQKVIAEPKTRLKKIATQIVANAKRFGVDYDKNLLMNLSENPPITCKVCNGVIEYQFSGQNSLGPSFDRQDNSLGYVRGNVAIIHKGCNRQKNNLTLSDIMNILTYLQMEL